MPQTPRSRRDAGLTAAFLGFFGAAWFGWAQANPPTGWSPWLTAASITSIVIALAGVVMAIRTHDRASAMRSRSSGRRYGIIVGIEFGLIFAGAAVLGAIGAGEYVSVWTCAVVGVHFFPLVPVLNDRGLYPLGIAMCVVAVAGLATGLATTVAATTVAGVGAGILLAGYSVVSLALGARRR